ncbi:rab-like protein 3 isoform X2 [Gordionus sp. m RMFG-2023]|uniref:rab-like protein 3 isoform X2 n=1 Tax=Gordionus sp. m RMFG-2023 TaxID=3053472 RepID=UPI0031FD5ED4
MTNCLPYDFESAKILILGDSGVGKTSLTDLICNNHVLENPKWTIGALVDIKMHIFKEGTPLSKDYFIEFWDIGGSTTHKNCWNIFFNSFHGLILVYDLTNYKSYKNLTKWIKELQNNQAPYIHIDEVDSRNFIGINVPILMVATKADLPYAGHTYKGKPLTLLSELGAEEIKLLLVKQTLSF